MEFNHNKNNRELSGILEGADKILEELQDKLITCDDVQRLPENLDEILNKIKRNRKCEIKVQVGFFEKFVKCLAGVSRLERGEGVIFSRLPGDGKEGELWFRNKLLWLKTIPLEDNAMFISLHSETGAYYKEKSGKISVDLMGIWRNEKTTRFAAVELKAGKGGDSIFYAVAEGLRNVYLLWQGLKNLSCYWEKDNNKCVKGQESVWRGGNPFSRLDKKNIQLLIIGDYAWMQKQKSLIKKVLDSVSLGRINVKISIYSLKEGGKTKSKPYALLPLKKYL